MAPVERSLPVRFEGFYAQGQTNITNYSSQILHPGNYVWQSLTWKKLFSYSTNNSSLLQSVGMKFILYEYQKDIATVAVP
jgi:hypothetical protein